jgi:hypothetical protein
VQQSFVVLGLVGEPAIIDKNILSPLSTLGFVSYMNGRKTRIVWRGRNSTNGVSKWPTKAGFPGVHEVEKQI